jgi:hypothetical protein
MVKAVSHTDAFRHRQHSASIHRSGRILSVELAVFGHLTVRSTTMRKLISVALAGALAASAVAATSTGAAAGKWQGKPYKGPYYSYNYYGPGPGAVAGAAIFGLALGALAAPLFNPYPLYPYAYYPPPPPPAYPVYPSYAYDPHVAWCSAQYGDAYYPATNTWVDMWGVVRVCVSPN